MKDIQYQKIIRSLPCCFCGEDRFGYVSWHHLLCIGQHSGDMKPPSWATIPVCKKCHDKCHSYEICRAEQKRAMVQTWINISGHFEGENVTLGKLGEAFWSAL